ncbi:MAG: hypothetical protein ACQ9MH_15360 [Nitrospinales bacterium]
MKPLITLITVFSFAVFSPAQGFTQRHGPHPELAIVILMDRGGTSIRGKEADEAKVLMIKRLHALKEHRATSDAHLEIIDMAEGRSTWTGTPRTILRDTDKIFKQIVTRPRRCSNLNTGFKALDNKLRSLEKREYKRIAILIWSPLINVAEPCGLAQITLPQPVPSFDFAGILMGQSKVSSVVFYWTHFQQTRFWREHLAPLNQIKKGVRPITFRMFEETETLKALEEGLDGVMQ